MTKTDMPQYDYEALRLILESESLRPVTIEEATRVGDDLVELYLALLSPPAQQREENNSPGEDTI